MLKKRKAQKKLLAWVRQAAGEARKLDTDKEEIRKKAFHNSGCFENALRLRGWSLVGSGYYSRVLINDKYPDRAIKILNKPETDGWLPYVDWATKNGYAGKLAPKVYSYKLFKGKTNIRKNYYDDPSSLFGVAVMERLDKTLSKATKKDAVSILPEIFHFAAEGNPIALQIADQVAPGYNDFAEKLSKEFEGLDLHNGNFMTRKDGSFVVTDPVSSYKGEFKETRLKYSVVDKSTTIH